MIRKQKAILEAIRYGGTVREYRIVCLHNLVQLGKGQLVGGNISTVDLQAVMSNWPDVSFEIRTEKK